MVRIWVHSHSRPQVEAMEQHQLVWELGPAHDRTQYSLASVVAGEEVREERSHSQPDDLAALVGQEYM